MINLRSSIIWGKTQHQRFSPTQHGFSYPLMFMCLDLGCLRDLPTKLLSYNRWSLLSVKDGDYLKDRHGSIADKLRQLLEAHGISSTPHQSFLLTVPRFLGYVFNPVNFYISIDQARGLHSFVAEVSNTFGEVHTYVLSVTDAKLHDERYSFQFPKEFYVSPFLKSDGKYNLSFSTKSENELRVDITLEQDGEKIFYANLFGDAHPLNDKNILLSLARYPFDCALTILRIQWQALLLISKKVRIYKKPTEMHEHTHRYAHSIIYSLRSLFLNRFTSQENKFKT